jgi:hypothetical protein
MNYAAKFKFADYTGAIKEVVLETSTDKIKYILLYCHQNAGQNPNISRDNRSFKLRRG